MKTVGILFSGGLDSTYLVYKNLKEGNRVIPFYCEMLNNSGCLKVEAEKEAIKKLHKLFKKEYCLNDIFDKTQIKIDSIERYFRSIKNTPQLPLLLFTLITNTRGVSMMTKNVKIVTKIDEFQLGYIIEDGNSVRDIKNIKNLYNAHSFLFSDTLPKLIFPILKLSKIDIFNSLLPERYLKHIHFCEEPKLINGKYVPCGECGYCETYQKIGLYDSYIELINKDNKKKNNIKVLEKEKVH